MPVSAEFYLSITRALAVQLDEALATLTPADLSLSVIGSLKRRPGVYQLYEDGKLVYIGKAEESLPDRILEHYQKISGRLNVGKMTFTCLYVDEDLHAVAPERLLIRQRKNDGEAAWNFNGFGNNDPGKARDTTIFKADHFDCLHPANLDWVCEDVMPGVYTADELLTAVKKALPYVFRYEKSQIYKTITVTLVDAAPTADELFTLLATTMVAINPKWRIVALPGYVIMYSNRETYPSQRAVYP